MPDNPAYLTVSDAYKKAASTLNPFTLEGLAKACRHMLPANLAKRPWLAAYPDKQFNVIFTCETQLNGYCAAYTDWHIGKLKKVFELARQQGVFAKGKVAVVDWGCGQGLATVALKEFVIGTSSAGCDINDVILIEPSSAALGRAFFNVRKALTDARVRALNKDLNALVRSDLRVFDCTRVIHLFSNILDLRDVLLKKVAENLLANPDVENYILCVSPFYPYMERRLDAFVSFFSQPLAFSHRGFKTAKEHSRDYTYCYQTFMLPANASRQSLQYKFFPPVKFRAGYALECVMDAVNGDVSAVALHHETSFVVRAPFEFAVGSTEGFNPVFSVLSNMVCRGLPTFCSPDVEDRFCACFDCSQRTEERGGFRFASKLREKDRQKIRACIGEWKLSDDDRINQLVFVPIAIARFHKVLIEAMLSGRMDFTAQQWRILVIEHDVPFARIALAEFEQMFTHISAMLYDTDLVRIPEIQLDVVPSGRFQDSKLSQAEAAPEIPSCGFDLVIEYSSNPFCGECHFSRFQVRNDCYFIISSRDVTAARSSRLIYTAEQIVYKPMCVLGENGTHYAIEDTVSHLRYFLGLLFRKVDFMPGQLPIINRALANKSVIGLLPTGGGKSLTYQLAALLQPGVTLVVDPLVSLMSDQYEGLRKARIDCCTFINRSISDEERYKREQKMEEARLLFVFVAPERLCIASFRNRLRNMYELGIYFSYGVIDEVHCVSEWGHDFRHSYLHLGRNLYQYVRPKQIRGDEHVALFGLTATASFDVLADVERDLSGEGSYPLDDDATVRYENTNRLELQFFVKKVESRDGLIDHWDHKNLKNNSIPASIIESRKKLEELVSDSSIERIIDRFIERENIVASNDKAIVRGTDLRISVIPDWVSAHPSDAAGIVFCPHRHGLIGVKDSNGVHSTLVGYFGVRSSEISMHIGGDDLSEQNRFLAGETNLMVSTNAFGMGIDKPNVRFTWHVCMPGSLEGFVQESGRSGRDKKVALATILYCPEKQHTRDETYEYEIVKYFFDQNFKGVLFEKRILQYLMSHSRSKLLPNEDDDVPVAQTGDKTVHGFMEQLDSAQPGQTFTYEMSTSYNEFDEGCRWLFDRVKVNTNEESVLNDLRLHYDSHVMKAIYRMCCIGVIDDFTQDYRNHKLRIVARKRADGEYYAVLTRFLSRYFTQERAAIEVARAKELRGENEVQKCLSFLTTFVYEKIAQKKHRAIKDMELFCSTAVNSTKDWLETNEDLKDFIYYYFNSKYARSGYSINIDGNSVSYSLVDDTDHGRIKDWDKDLLVKYLAVVDDDHLENTSSKDNVKHLQGAVRLIRRAETGAPNPVLSLLNVFCLCFLGFRDNDLLVEECIRSLGPDGFGQILSSGAMRSNELWKNFAWFEHEVATRAPDCPKDILSDIFESARIEMHLASLKDLMKHLS